eukprot:3068746-Pyramimonas_sp.AAC.1
MFVSRRQVSTFVDGKLHKFLRMVRLMMEDAMQFMVLRSLTAFADFIELHCMVELNIVDSGEVHPLSARPLIPPSFRNGYHFLKLLSLQKEQEGGREMGRHARRIPP